jgi:elongation factor Ts
MEITTERIKELRQISGAGVMDCRSALIETRGNIEEALGILKEQNLLRIEKKSERTTSQGLIDAYVHTGGRIGAVVELNCETDFVARTQEFRELAHNISMQIAAQEPLCIAEEQLPDDAEVEPEVACLLLQPFIKDPELTIQDLINETAAKVGENIKISRFTRFELGQTTQGVVESAVGNTATSESATSPDA